MMISLISLIAFSSHSFVAYPVVGFAVDHFYARILVVVLLFLGCRTFLYRLSDLFVHCSLLINHSIAHFPTMKVMTINEIDYFLVPFSSTLATHFE